MGASGWAARAPFGDGDIGAALQQARQRAYDEGAFYRAAPNAEARSMGEAEYMYPIGYRDDQPDEIFFVGFSGD